MSSDASGSNNEHQDSKTNDDSCVQESTIAVAQALQSHYDGASGAGDGSIDASESSLTPKGQDIADKTVDGSGDTSKIDISNPENQTKDTTNPYNDELKCASHAQDQVYHENIVNIDMKTVSNKFLEPVSGSASPKTPISTDEDLVLKWDDDEESEEQNTGEEKIKGDDDNAETNYFNLHDSDEKKQATLNTSDELMEQIDQQISELDTKNIDSKNDDQTGIVEISSDILNEINDTASEKELKSSETSSTIESTGKFKSDFMELDDDTDLDINTKSVDKLIDKLETVISEQSDIDRTDSLSNKNMDKETTDVQKKCESLPVMEESADTTITSIESKVESEIQDIPEQTLDTVDHSAEAPEVVESMDVDKKETTFKDNFNITDDKAAANSTALDVDNTIEELSETIHSSDETLIEPREHNLNKTDVMLDIPTQELIECMDESVELSKIDNTTHMEVSQTAQIALKNEVDVSITEEKVEESTDGSKLDPKNIMDIEINSKSVTENSETKTSEVVNSAISEEVLLSEQKMNVDDIGNKTTTEETCRKITEQSSTKVQALNSDETTNECEPCKQSDKGNSEDIPDKETAKSHETVIEKPTECEPCKPSDECNSESIPAIETAKSHKTVIENPTSESDNQAIPQIISSELDNHALEKEDHSTDQHISETIANRSDPKVIETITEKSDSNEVTTFDDASFQETSPKIVPSTPITEENKTLSTDVIVTDKKESKSNEQCSLTVTDGIAKEAETKDSPIEAMKGTTEMPSTITVPINREGEEKTSEIQTLEVKEIMEQPSTNTIPQTTETEEKTIKETSQMEADTSEDVLEVTDSLGLLAESSRVVEDDEEQETSDHDEVDDDDDFDPDDESSNQMTTAEMSEDSNAQLFESDLPKVEVMDTIPDDNAQDYLEKDMGTPPDGLGIPPDELGTTPADTVDTADSANLETDIDEPNIEDFINKVDEISEVDADMLDEVEGLSPTDVQSPSADNLAEDDKGCAFAISNVVSETEATKDVGGSENIDKDIDEKLAKESPVAAKTVKTIITTEAEDKAKKDDAAKDSPVESKPPGGETQLLRKLLANEIAPKKIKLSPSKLSQMVVAKQKDVINIVDLGESSSEEVKSTDAPDASKVPPVTGDITASSGAANDAAPHVDVKSKPRTTSKNYGLNLDEISIKTRASATEPLAIPEVKTGEPTSEEKDMEVLTLDSDEDEHTKATEPTPPASKTEVDIRQNKCINSSCPSDMSAPICPADRLCVAYYEPDRKRKGFVCHECANAVAERTQRLIDGVRDFTPLLEMDMGRPCQDLVEISDSESDSEPEDSMADSSLLGVEEATQVEEKLVNMINATWEKFKMDARLDDTQAELNAELERLDKESKEIDEMLRECQAATDKLRSELYASFEPDTQSQPTLIIFDTPDTSFTKIEAAVKPEEVQNRELKRRLSSTSDISKPPSKRTSLPAPAPDTPSLPTDGANKETKADTTLPSEGPTTQADDDKDVSVVTLSAESAPADLPPAGELTRPPLRVGMAVYAMRNSFGTWLKARVVECIPKGSAASSTLFTMCRVKFESKNHKNQYKMLPARCLAYNEPADVRMTIGTRLVALFKDPINTSRREAYYSGIVAEVPNPVNNYRYLVFFDDGYAQYVQHADTRLVCECAARVWEEVHPFSREFVRQYLTAYPERPMVRLHTGQSLKTELNGKWWVSRVIKVDASLVQVHFEKDNRTEWIYRGSTRLAPLYLELQAAERHRARPMPRNRLQNKMNMPYVEYTRSDDASSKADAQAADQTQQEELRRAQRAVAKKSVGGPVVIAGVGGGVLAGGVGRVPPAAPPPPPSAAPDAVTSRVVYYTPKNAVRPYKMVPHNCGPKCKRTDVLKLHELRTYNPLAKPLLSGWERQLVRYKGHKEVVYRAPCGRRLRHIRELHRYLRLTQSDMGVDLFDFGPSTHCLAEFVLNKCIIAKKDLSNGKENVPVPCVNYYDNSLPEFCSYNTERTPTDGVPLNLDPDFLCGCDCTDDCEDKSKCACWQLTLEGARTIGLNPRHVGYSYKRLPEPLPSGIYECNSRCKCKSTCLNRVAQHPLQLKLQVFKTLNRGWGIRALNDVPKGAFLCVYAGNLLTDATANLDGLNEGDEYLAELDYIEVVEQMKEGYEEDIPEADRRMDKKELGEDSSTEEDSSEEEAPPSKDEKKDGDFQVMGPMNINSEFRKTLRKREKKEKKDEKDAAGNERNKDKDNGGGKDGDEDCITISDDEEVREPSRFAAQPGMGSEFVSKYKSVRSYFGKDEACYIMDAKVQGNIGRYLNHSCSPNVFVQNVFVDTHDPRFPWVAFFALLPIRAGTELTWNYNYDIGSVPGKVLYCYCGAANCRGRLL